MEQSFPHLKSSTSKTAPCNVIGFPEAEVDLAFAYLRGLPSAQTRVVYRRALRQFDSFLGDNHRIAATRRDVEAFRSHLEQLGRAPATISKTLAALSGFYAFAQDEGEVDRNPAERARRPKVPSVSPRQGLSPAEVQALLFALDIATTIGMRDRVLLLLLAVQAWRVSECLGLHAEDLGEEAGHKVATVHGKGAKVCRVTLAASTWMSIKDWMKAADITQGPILVPVRKDGLVTQGKAISAQSAWRRLRLLGQRAGLSRPVHAHLFRHGAATSLLDKGVPLRDVQDHLRHADPRTTRRYDSHRLSLENQSAQVLSAAVCRPCSEAPASPNKKGAELPLEPPGSNTTG